MRSYHLELALVTIGLLLGLASLLLGAADYSPTTLWQALRDSSSDPGAHLVLWDLRLPRLLLAALVGAHFALSGLVLQAVLRNLLADPGILGISSGATLAVMLFLLFDAFAGTTDNSQLAAYRIEWLPAVAQLGGLGGLALVYGLSWQRGTAPSRLILMGIAVGATLYALAMSILAGWGSSRVEVVLTWLAGNLYGRSWAHLALLWPWSVALLLVLPLLLPALSVMALGDARAGSLGLRVELWRLAALAYAGIAAAAAVGICGPLGFVGLIAPHLARLLRPGGLAQRLPLTLLLGAVVTIAADLFGRLVLAPTEIPVGAVTPLLGAPLFLYLLSKSRC
ncbi:FecCD family ABC transporter permease [Andreprevotia chitinilytica]|uniref:FecCD family ABC transporter permease n=1 Tax=Andreprevotia chitinilytica TaxID=396808 RepID=UPI00055248E1|nr:iron ABC transporter permease [Andreprevotia chitinilytica]